jgi:hypothetical protein
LRTTPPGPRRAVRLHMLHLVRHLNSLATALANVERAWVEPLELSGFHVHQCDVIHHVCMASAIAHPLMMREAYLSLIGLADCLKRAEEAGLSEEVSVYAQVCIGSLLDDIEPHVSRPDISLRRSLDETTEETLARILQDGQ